MKPLTLSILAAAQLGTCGTPATTDSEEFCEVAYSVPVAQGGCMRIEGDFTVYDVIDQQCVARPGRYSCISSRESLYVDGAHEVTDMVADTECMLCNGASAVMR